MIQENVSLKKYNTFGIEAKAKRFAVFSTTEELNEILQQSNEDELLILGGGSNLLLTQDFEGLVIRNEIKGFEVVNESENDVCIKVGSGEVWHEFVLRSIENNFGGVENLSLIPGSVGASPMQNIGAYGVEIKDVFIELEAYHIETGKVKIFSHKECRFGYRESVFKRELKGEYIIVSVTYRLTKNKHQIKASYGAIQSELESNHIDSPSIKDISDAVIAIRSSKLPDPKEIGNAGSFFKNPVVDRSILEKIQLSKKNVPNYPAPNNQVKLAAGWLIEQAGWKGKTFDNYGVHKNQALVLVNYSDCTGEDILNLSTQIIEDVKVKFEITLEREVNII
ncbi:MAG TPA: UDP-N-acetylmuramate dehydrogenase [Crocinitomicaceae bacterium]|nr:UDP-N-acetylmuramate dehydrogenase [Crocinitomicaceae bacterium]